MTTTRLFVDVPLHSGERLQLPEAAAHHLLRVLRARTGTALVLFNGQGGEYSATLTEAGRRQATVEVGAHHLVERESRLNLWLAQGVSRGERMDFTLQKAVELGVNRLIPVLCERTTVRLDAERWHKREQHWRGVIVSACEQCGRNRVPELLPVIDFSALLPLAAEARALLLHGQADASLDQINASSTRPILLTVGPEGGFAAAELSQALSAGFTGLRLGPRILRTETAALAAISALQARCGDFFCE